MASSTASHNKPVARAVRPRAAASWRTSSGQAEAVRAELKGSARSSRTARRSPPSSPTPASRGQPREALLTKAFGGRDVAARGELPRPAQQQGPASACCARSSTRTTTCSKSSSATSRSTSPSPQKLSAGAAREGPPARQQGARPQRGRPPVRRRVDHRRAGPARAGQADRRQRPTPARNDAAAAARGGRRRITITND